MSQVYKKTDWPIHALVEGIDKHHIGLPDLQRPYVRNNARVRNLFDSLYRGYPTGLLIFLENETDEQIRTVGENNELRKIPQYVVIDGQQRLTSLYAAITGFKIEKENGKYETISISFNPVEESFKVADATTAQGKDWIYNINTIIHGDDLLEISNDYLIHFKEKYGDNPEKVKKIAQRIQKVHNIKNIDFICIEIFKNVPIEIVSEIFLRINSGGKTLNNSDFILTLMSVYREEGRKGVEAFSKYTRKRNDIIQLGEDEVVRILIGVGFKRAKLEDTYNYLKAQKKHFDKLEEVLKLITDLNHWHNFLVLLKDLGLIHEKLITQKSVVIATYIFYLLGINKFGSNFQELGPIIKKYYLAMFLTQKYSSNAFETVLGKDFQKLNSVDNKEDFFNFINNEIDSHLTNDMWKITFPKNMQTQAIRSPLFVAYTASQIYFQKTILFRKAPISKFFIDLKDKEAINEKTDIDIHHIFPRQYLLDNFGADEIKTTQINQIANKVYTYKTDNKMISDKSPKEYIEIFSELGKLSLENNLADNAIPLNFQNLEYFDFLKQRSNNMLGEIKKYMNSVIQGEQYYDNKDDLKMLILSGESNKVEFKGSYRRDHTNNTKNDYLKFQVVKTINAFLNSNGGTLFVGVKDDSEILGLENDLNTFNDKKMDTLLIDIDNLLKKNFSESYALINVYTSIQEDKEILVFKVEQSSRPVYITINGKPEFYIRRAASSIALTVNEAVNYVKDHFVHNSTIF